MPFGSKRADLLERSLQGDNSTDQEVCDLVTTAGRIPALTSPACAPRDEFVRMLGITLRAEALTLPARKVRPVPSAAGAPRSTARPMVFVIGRGWPRILVGATASLLLVGAVVGGASRSALPGGLLYPVKELLNSAAVQLAGSQFDRGVTLLSQAQEHISDAGALVEREGARADPAFVDQALLGAYDAASTGQRALLGEFDRTGNPQALITVQDFVVRALPQLNALRPLVPESSRPQVGALIILLQETRTTLAGKIAVCGQPCASLGSSPLSAPSTGLPSKLTTGGLPMPDLPTLGGFHLPAPTAAVNGPLGVLVGPPVYPFLSTTSAGGTTLPPVTIGTITVSPPPIPIPLLPMLTPPPARSLVSLP